MYNINYINKIKEIFENSTCKTNVSSIFKNNYKDLYDYILNSTNFLKDNPSEKIQKDGSRIPFIARIYVLLNNITEQPKCAICGKDTFYKHHLKSFSKWCSLKCSCKDKSTHDKRIDSLHKKYGNNLEKIIDKSKKTRFEKYGSYTSSNFGEKVKKTKLDHFGNENFVNVDKAKQTKLEKYGDEKYSNLEKSYSTKLERYGDSHFNNRIKFKSTVNSFSDKKKKEINNKRISTCIEKYGVFNPKKLNKVNEKYKNTLLKKYGVDSSFKLKNCKDNSRIKQRNDSYDFMLLSSKNDNVEMINSKDEFLNVKNLSTYEFSWKCLKCGYEFKSRYDNGHCVRLCPNCSEEYSKKEQYELYSFLKSIIIDEIIVNDRTLIFPYELDFFIPSKKIAFEFDGLFWHNENHKHKNYHLYKTDLCKQQGIKLIHIFEDEWRNQKKIVKSRIKNILLKQKSIYARKCEIVEIDNHTKDIFLEKYHLQGKDISNIRYALKYKNHIVAVMTFVKPRFSKKYEYELSRYATISNFRIIGGASKLLKHFEKIVKPSSLITYADRRWSNGNLYFKLGFTHIHNSSPSYYYIKNDMRYNRISFQKHKLNKLFDNIDNSKSEHEIMQEYGYYRIYDCGNMVFEKIY